VPDVVRDGENGLLFNAGDVRALAAALARLCDEAGLLEALATRARRTIVEEHDLETAARALTLALSGGTEADARSR
jgi:glycosyltransferase involved in cell wall biosynthesis